MLERCAKDIAERCTRVRRTVLFYGFFLFGNFACLDRQSNDPVLAVNADDLDLDVITGCQRVTGVLGAITGEAGVGGEAVGRIDIKESHSVVEVHEQVARTVIQSLNGTSIHGRAARVDFDRPRGKAPPRKGRSPR